MLDKLQLAALLGRPLTSVEDTNYQTYIDIATKRLSNLLCMALDSDIPTRLYGSRRGYRTLYIDPFTEITSVSIDGTEREDFTKKLNDSYNGSWFNSIEFDRPLCGERVEIEATWGFGESLPDDLALLLAELFGTVAGESETNRIESKEIEDFKVTYRDTPAFDAVLVANAATVAQYAQCERGILHGPLQTVYY